MRVKEAITVTDKSTSRSDYFFDCICACLEHVK